MVARGALTLAIVALAGCSLGSDERQGERSPGSGAGGPAALVLLHDNRVVRVSLVRGTVDAEVDLGPRRAGPAQLGQRLGSAGDGVLALVGERIVALDAASLKRRATHRLEPGVRYAGMVVGRSGTMYAYGERRTRRGWWKVVITRVGSSRRTTATVRGAEPLPSVYWGAISADERRFLLSYHGGPDGADWFGVSRRGFERCRPPHRRVDLRRHPRCLWSATGGGGRLHVHGAVAPSGEGFLAATGRSRLIEIDGDGRLVRDWDPRTRQTHLMNFVLDAGRERVVVGSCAGIGAVDLASGRMRVVPRREACDETPLAVHGERVLVARGRSLAVVDLARRRTVARLTVPAEPVAAVVVDATR
jgi:hypothetical protein